MNPMNPSRVFLEYQFVRSAGNETGLVQQLQVELAETRGRLEVVQEQKHRANILCEKLSGRLRTLKEVHAKELSEVAAFNWKDGNCTALYSSGALKTGCELKLKRRAFSDLDGFQSRRKLTTAIDRLLAEELD